MGEDLPPLSKGKVQGGNPQSGRGGDGFRWKHSIVLALSRTLCVGFAGAAALRMASLTAAARDALPEGQFAIEQRDRNKGSRGDGLPSLMGGIKQAVLQQQSAGDGEQAVGDGAQAVGEHLCIAPVVPGLRRGRLLAPATVKRSRNRSSCLGLIACTRNPRSSNASTTGPCGTSIATAIASARAAVRGEQPVTQLGDPHTIMRVAANLPGCRSSPGGRATGLSGLLPTGRPGPASLKQTDSRPL